jgi:K+-sensing histidine kinase KdpD
MGLPVFKIVPRLIAAGITVLGTLHMLSIAGTRSAFESMLPGTPQPGRLIDDAFLATVDEFELVDIPPTDLLARLRETPTLTPAELARAMQTELRPPVLKALRESAFRLIAEQSDRQLVGYLRERQMAGPWEGRGHVVLALQAAPGQEGWIRRIASYASSQDARFSVATVRTRSLSSKAREWMGAYASLTHQLGGTFVHLHGRSVAPTLIAYLRDDLATEVVLGHRRHGRWRPGDTTSRVIDGLSEVDVHVLRADAA